MMEREAFQEIDYRQMFGPMAKWVAQIDDADRIPELVVAGVPRRHLRAARARSCSRCRRTCSSRRSDAADARPYEQSRGAPGSRRRRAGRARCSTAPSARSSSSAARRGAPRRTPALTAWCDGERASRRGGLALPGLRRQHVGRRTSATSALGADPRLAQRVRDADVLLVIGERLSEITTAGYTLLERAEPGADADPRQPRSRRARPGVRAGARDRRRRRMPSRSRSPRLPPLDALRGGAEARARAHADYLDNLRHRPGAGRAGHGRGDGDAARAPARGRDPHERRRQLLGLGAPLLRVPALPHPARADERRDGLRRSRRGGGEARSIPSGSSSRWRATATS